MTTRLHTFDGNIGIGTNDPGSYKLNVNGGVKADSLVINGVTNSQIPIGLIQIWYGTVASIPPGWELCDGTTGITRSDGNGTIDVPNLVNRFIRGAASTPQVGQTAGNNTVSLTEANLPGHEHTFNTTNAGTQHTHEVNTTQTSHDHGETTDQANAGHGHQDTNYTHMGHNHILDNHAAPHTHNLPSTQGKANANHDHGNLASANAPHYHGAAASPVYAASPCAGPGSGSLAGWTTANENSSYSYANHNHGGFQNHNMLHSHNTGEHNMLHDHGINAANANHNHGNTGNQDAPHVHVVQANATVSHLHETNSAGNADHAHPGTTASTGQENAITITNPYYILAYIMKI